MDHPAIDELWLDLAEGTLPEPEAHAVRAHLESCPACSARYERLARAHELSVQAARMVRAQGTPPVPDAVARRVLAASREAAGASRARRGAWALPAFAAVAAAAALIVALRVGGARTRQAELMRGTLALLATPGSLRGPGEPLAAAAEDAAERWRGGALTLRVSTVRCPGGEVRVLALADHRGAPVLVAIREGDRTDLYLYGDDGSETGSARFRGSSRTAFLLPPRPRPDAQAFLDAPSCPGAR
jgi:anti-sigma factor RsiW